MAGGLAQRGAVPQRFGFDIGLGVFRLGPQPVLEGAGVVLAGALQADQPVQRLLAGTGAGIRLGG